VDETLPSEHRHDLGLRSNRLLVGRERIVMTSFRFSVPVAARVGLLSMVAGWVTGHLVGGLVSPTASPFLAGGTSS
jgi:hypothetical protein